MADLSPDIEAAAKQPKRASADGTTAEAHSLQDQIEADRYLASKAAAKSAKRGLNLTKLSPPGTT